MTSDLFIEKSEQEVAKLSVALRALWHAGRNEWDVAHELVQEDSSKDCAWVHAYLHRVEGDIDNARYWYHLAGKPAAQGELRKEFVSLVRELGGL